MRAFQNILVEILKDFSEICEKNNLTFFLIAGTLLGAVRHKGIIPWDADIDVGMPREDYEKLIAICKKEQPDGYFLQEGRTYAKYWHIFAKFRKNNTYKFEKNPPRCYLAKEHRGVNIDVFPFDFVSSKNILKRIQFFLQEHIRHLLARKRGYRFDGKLFPSVVKNIITFILPFKFFHWFSRFIMTLKDNEKKYYISWAGIYGYEKETHLYKDIFPLNQLEFEEKCYCVPCNWDAYLKKMYGNYMELPPIRSRSIHPPKYILG